MSARRRLLLFAACLGAAGLLLWALCAARVIRPREIARAADRLVLRAEARRAVQRPWHPDNPYRVRYDEADYWIYENLAYVQDMDGYLVGATEVRRKMDAFAQQDGEQLATMLVDGYLLPYREYYRQQAEAASAGEESEFGRQGVMVVAAGPANERERERIAQLQWELKADLYPWVPDWLAASPPLRAQILPDGSVLTEGALGSAQGLNLEQWRAAIHAPERKGEPRRVFCHYSPQGELLSDRMSEFEVPGWQTLPLAELSAQGKFHISHGYIELRDKQGGELLRLFDFDGRELPLDTPRQQRINNFRRINALDLLRLYRIQREHSPLPQQRAS